MEAADRLLAGLWRYWVAGMRHAALMQAFGNCADERTLVLLELMRDDAETTAVGQVGRRAPAHEISDGQSYL